MRIPKFSSRQEKMWNVLMFLARLLVLSAPLYIILWFNVSLEPLQHAVADQASWLLNLFGFPTEKSGLLLTVGESGASVQPFTFLIGPDCTGWKSMISFFALVFASLGVGMRKRFSGIAIGIPLIYLGNLARIMVVVFIERSFGIGSAMFFHDFLWQAGLISLVLVLWVIWLRWDNVMSGFSYFRDSVIKI